MAILYFFLTPKSPEAHLLYIVFQFKRSMSTSIDFYRFIFERLDSATTASHSITVRSDYSLLGLKSLINADNFMYTIHLSSDSCISDTPRPIVVVLFNFIPGA